MKAKVESLLALISENVNKLCTIYLTFIAIDMGILIFNH